MNDDTALQVLSRYVRGCGGVLCAGWRAKPRWELRNAKHNVCITSMPPEGFMPVGGQKRKDSYSSLKQVADAMGLKQNVGLARSLTAAARREDAEHGVVGVKKSSPGPQDTEKADVRGKKRTRPNAGIVQTIVAERARVAAQLASGTGMQVGPGDRHSEEKMERLQHENKELKLRNATLERKVKYQQSEQFAREEEIREQYLAHAQTINHLFSENKALRAASQNRRQSNEDAMYHNTGQ